MEPGDDSHISFEFTGKNKSMMCATVLKMQRKVTFCLVRDNWIFQLDVRGAMNVKPLNFLWECSVWFRNGGGGGGTHKNFINDIVIAWATEQHKHTHTHTNTRTHTRTQNIWCWILSVRVVPKRDAYCIQLFCTSLVHSLTHALVFIFGPNKTTDDGSVLELEKQFHPILFLCELTFAFFLHRIII